MSYLLSALLLLPIKEPSFQPHQYAGWRQLKEGLTHIKDDFRWTLCLVKTLWSIAGAVSVLLAVLGEEKYAFGGRPMLGVSILFVARGIGTGLGPSWLVP